MNPPNARSLGPRGLLTVFAFWTALALIGAGFGILLANETDLDVRLRFALFGVLHAWIWAGLTPLIFWLAGHAGLERGGRWRSLALLAIGGVAVAILTGTLSAGLFALNIVPLTPEMEDGFRPGVIGRSFVPNLLIYSVVAATGLARAAEIRSRRRHEEAATLEARNAQLQAQLAEARLTVLRSQLNPHFLFNTLNAVSGLMDEDPRGARRMITRLSDLLRYALAGAGDREITLEKELELAERYLEIVEIRYQGRLRVSVSSELDTLPALVPTLILQPLIENAMKHGVSRARGHGTISVRAEREGDHIVLSVTDSGPAGIPEGGVAASLGEEGMGLGLSHTRQRLREAYGQQQSFDLIPTAEGGMTARISLPYRLPASEHSLANSIDA